jgi:exopolyphosphatase / guanosine-5'-triphosphate,3'-diphosphate pyrophosphatase
VDHANAQGRLAVIDIGSNSMRCVVYERLNRAPVALFNEKTLPGLGRSLERTGKLNPEGVTAALDNLDRFRRLLAGMEVHRIETLATAAVRDASDGDAFVAAIRARTGLDVTVLSGTEEARLSAMGVLSGAPDADGIAADLGGGSLELVELNGHAISMQATAPLGPLRLMEATDGKISTATRLIDKHLESLPWLARGKGRGFHPVGGAWRTLAKMHVEQSQYPLHIIHQYKADATTIADFAASIARMSRATLERQPGVSKRRLETLPLAALALERTLKATQAAHVIFSAYGLREGLLYDMLPDQERRRDPLIVAATDLAAKIGRFGHAETLDGWTCLLFMDEHARFNRLRATACLLSDLGWMEHPDYRAEHAFLRILRMPFVGIDHQERAFLAASLFVRYGGEMSASCIDGVRPLLTPSWLNLAQRTGLALRLAHTLTGGAALLLERTTLRLTEDRLDLLLPQDVSMLNGEAVQRRLDALAKAFGRSGAIRLI